MTHPEMASSDLVHPFLALRGAGPALREGVSLRSAAIDAGRRSGGYLAALGKAADDLPAQRWGVVATNDERGARLIELTARLAERRGQDQGEAPHVYRVDPGMTARRAEEFVRGPYWDEVGRSADRLPRYLLLLGDAAGVSWELQQAFARHGAFPGRLAFDGDAGYEAYVDKALAWEARDVPERESLHYAVRDGSPAVTKGQAGLMAPSHRALSAAGLPPGVKASALDLSPVVLDAAGLESEAQAMLSRAAAAQGGLLVSLSHGVGLEKGASIEERRAAQGAVHLHAGRALGAADVANGPFFEGGAWFFFACFSAGTPSSSVYRPWLQSLAARGYTGRRLAEQALAALPEPPAPFVAALPKAALASPHGPLAVFGHVDLAWSWSFAPASLATGKMVYQSRHERFDAVLLALLERRRFGAALHELAAAGSSVGQNLLALYGEEGQEAEGDAAAALHRACLWLEHNDLGGFVLLGDPAARLPRTSAEAAREARPSLPRAAVAGPPPDEVLVAEEEILACLANKQDPEEVAPTVGRTPEEMKELVSAYQEAGRRALAELCAARRR